MKCDELTPVTREYADEYWADRFAMVYNADEVDAAIAELKEIIEKNQSAYYVDLGIVANDCEKLKAENAQLKKEIEFMHSNCKWNAGKGCARLMGEKLAIIDDNVKLKQKLESVQASMYADLVDAGMENRKLKAENERLVKCCKEYDSRQRIDERIKFNFAKQLRSTKRALWVARAASANFWANYWFDVAPSEYIKYDRIGRMEGVEKEFILTKVTKHMTASDWVGLWEKVELLCRNKVEDYK